MIASIHDAGEAFWGATEVFLVDSGMTLRQNRLRVGMELLGRVMAEGRDLLKALSLSPFSWRATAGVGLGPASRASTGRKRDTGQFGICHLILLALPRGIEPLFSP